MLDRFAPGSEVLDGLLLQRFEVLAKPYVVEWR
jgi:hypothetical protein